ncbi:MAG: TOBE domain-containing protein, partial [Maritimibacter sp.]
RSIVRDPSIFLFDEPLSNLDAELRVQMRVELARLHEHLGNTMIYVTHDQVEAMTMADQIVVMKDGQVMQVGSPLELYNRPANRFVAGFIGSPKMNFIEAQLAGDGALKVADTRLELGANRSFLQPTGTPVSLGIRPEHILTGDAGGQALGQAQVHLVEHLGGSTVIHASLNSGPNFGPEITVMVPGQMQIASGDSLPLSIDPGNCHLFSMDGARLCNE